MNSKYVEALKEFIRTGFLAAATVVVPQLIDMLSSGAEIDWRVLGVAAVIALLRAVDRLLHVSGVETPLDLTGLDALKG